MVGEGGGSVRRPQMSSVASAAMMATRKTASTAAARKADTRTRRSDELMDATGNRLRDASTISIGDM